MSVTEEIGKVVEKDDARTDFLDRAAGDELCRRLRDARAGGAGPDTVGAALMSLFERCRREGRMSGWLERVHAGAVITLRIPDGVEIDDDPSRGGRNRVSLAFADGSGIAYWIEDGAIRAVQTKKMAPFEVFLVIRERCMTLNQCWRTVPPEAIRAFVNCMDIDFEKFLAGWEELRQDREILHCFKPVFEQFRRNFHRELRAYGTDKGFPEDDGPKGGERRS